MNLTFNLEKDRNIVVLINEIKEDYNLEILNFHGFEAKNNQIIFLNNNEGILCLVGILNCDDFCTLGSNCFNSLKTKNLEKITIDLNKLNVNQMQEFLYGFFSSNYEFNKYLPNKERIKLNNVNVLHLNSLNENEISNFLFEINTSKKVKDWVNTPCSDLFPLEFAKEISEFLTPLNVNVKIIKGKDIEKFGLLYSVGKASENEPCCIVMEYNNHLEEEAIAFVGKGVMYDTGGLSLKPAIAMTTMKADMAGAATVVGIIANAAKNKINKKIIGIVGLVENAIGSKAYRPDDVIISYNKTSVEITNTDAEGRLVLADLFSYVQENYKINILIDLATLTGAIKVALGTTYAGLFSNNKQLSNMIIENGEKTKELIHNMPLHEDYFNLIKSEIANLKNCANQGPGASTAAEFLNYFINKQIKWAHLDIAGVAFLEKKSGATGFGLKLFKNFLQNI